MPQRKYPFCLNYSKDTKTRILAQGLQYRDLEWISFINSRMFEKCGKTSLTLEPNGS